MMKVAYLYIVATFCAMVLLTSDLAYGEDEWPVIRWFGPVLATPSGLDHGIGETRGPLRRGRGLPGGLTYTMSIEGDLKPGETSSQLFLQRFHRQRVTPSNRFVFEPDEMVIRYRREGLSLDYPLTRLRRYTPLAVTWSFTTPGEPTFDVLIVMFEQLIVTVLVPVDDPKIWTIAVAPALYSGFVPARLLETGYGLFRQGEQYVLFLPGETPDRDRAWEFHPPETIDGRPRYNVFPIPSD